MGAFINAGGSLTLSAVVLAAIYVVRAVKTRKSHRAPAVVTYDTCGKHHSSLSPDAVRLLASIDPIPHYILDIRPAAEAAAAPLPHSLAAAVHVPGGGPLLQAALTTPAGWDAVAGRQAPPSSSHLLVFVASNDEDAKQAAGLAAACGYQRTAVVQGGAAALRASPTPAHLQPDPDQLQAQEQQQQQQQRQRPVRHIHRDALAVLLGRLPLPPGLQVAAPCCVLDVRRHDERALYGALPGALHVPADELAAALAAGPEAFRQRYREPLPARDQPLVLASRTNLRALWAAQLTQDAGYTSVFVYKQGVYGWRLDRLVKPYSKYQVWEVPPEPEPYALEEPDPEAGLHGLSELGLLLQEA